jgi:hypothetical protein
VESGVRSRNMFISWPLAGDSIKSPRGVHTRFATGLKELVVMALASDKSAESSAVTWSFVDDMAAVCDSSRQRLCRCRTSSARMP